MVVPRESRGRGGHGGARDGVPSRGARGGDAHRTPPGLSRRNPGPQSAEEPGLLHRRRVLARRLCAANVHAAHAAYAARGREGKGHIYRVHVGRILIFSRIPVFTRYIGKAPLARPPPSALTPTRRSNLRLLGYT